MGPYLFELADIFTDVACIPLPSLLLLLKLLQHVQNCVISNPKRNYYFCSLSFFVLGSVDVGVYIRASLLVFGLLMKVENNIVYPHMTEVACQEEKIL